MFLIRLTLRLARFFLIDMPLQLLGMVLVGIYFIVARPTVDDLKLPNYLKFFDCADLYAEFDRNPITYMMKVLPESRLYRYYWLTIRNPINYFSYKYYAAKAEAPVKLLKLEIKPQRFVPPGVVVSIGDSSQDVSGSFLGEYSFNGNKYYEYYIVHVYSDTTQKLLNTVIRPEKPVKYCFRMRLGHKIGLPQDIKKNEYIQDVFNINPFHSYNGL